MKAYRFDGEVIPEHLNSVQLQAEIAEKLKLTPEEVGVTAIGAGESESLAIVDGKRVVERKAIEPQLVISVPTGSYYEVEQAVRAHAPTLDDHEAAATAEQERFNQQVLASAPYQALLGRVDALEKARKP